MSLSKDKSALFGGGKGSAGASSSSSASSSTSPPPSAAPKLATVGSGSVSSSISPALRQKKLEEAKEWISKASNHLKTSFFNWNPDFLAAAPCYESASNAYQVILEYDKAREALLSCAECNEKAGCITAAAFTFSKVAQICQLQKQPEKAAEYFNQSAQIHGLNGEIDKMADMLCKCAKEWESVNPERASSTYLDACERIFPASTSPASVVQLHPKVLDIFREAFLFHVRKGMFPLALELAQRSCVIFEGFESDVSLCKMMVSITILQLAQGDVVAADHTFLQEHLSNSNYIRSKECALAESFIAAYKSRDIEQLDAAKRCVDLNYLDKDVQNVAKKLSVVSGANNWPMPAEPVEPKKSSASAAVESVFRQPPELVPSPPISEAVTDENELEDLIMGNTDAKVVDQNATAQEGEEDEVDIC